MAVIMKGTEVSDKIRQDIKNETKRLKERGIIPSLSVIIVGDDFASGIYVKKKKEACDQLGFDSKIHDLPESTTQDELIALIEKLNQTPEVDGILVQLPLPKHIDSEKIIAAISPLKDVDAFHPVNVGKIMIGSFDFAPCTPQGVMEILKYYGVEIAGKNCVIVGRSNIVGKPAAMLMLKENATVTICHSRTKDLAAITKSADIIICAVGKINIITSDMVKEGAVVVDVGMNRGEDKKLKGDVDFEGVSKKAAYITPVPGGVGPMTVTMLMQNTLRSALLREKRASETK
jgi:methylenetetrahydrofolate dehydrogenase (NADP+)/methenyltetrahydrofolate cyclohydrolase